MKGALAFLCIYLSPSVSGHETKWVLTKCGKLLISFRKGAMSMSKVFGVHIYYASYQNAVAIPAKNINSCMHKGSSISGHRYNCKEARLQSNCLPHLRLSLARKPIDCLPRTKSKVWSADETAGINQMVRVKFQLEKECEFGDVFQIVGDDPVLGSWNPSDAITFNWSNGHVWTLDLELPVANSIQYKFLLREKLGEAVWQSGPDRTLRTWETDNVILVAEDWDNAEAQKITEQRPTISKYKTPPGMSTVQHSALNPLNLPEEPLPSVSNRTNDDANVDTQTTIINSRALPLNMNTGNNASMKNNRTFNTTMNKSSVRNYQKSSEGLQGIRSAEGEYKGKLVTYDEGPVLVPGLTVQMMSS